MRIALVHDYLSQKGGAEKVLQAFHEIWPEAPIFVLFHDKKKIKSFKNTDIRETFIKKLPGAERMFQWYLPLMPSATEKHDLNDFDVVLSSTSSFAKGVITPPESVHICYCHTPPRFLWAGTHRYLSDLPYNKVIKSFLTPLLHRLRLWDTLSTNRVDHFLSNSNTVNLRIQKYYRRQSDTIYPPVKTKDFHISKNLGNYFLAGGRLVPYKRFDLIVQAFNRLGLPIKIFGLGPELKKLKKIAKPNIEFIGYIEGEEKSKILSECLGFINPQIEDFGITTVEATASGRPIIAYRGGGATESVEENKTGIFFEKQNWQSLTDAILKFNSKNWDSQYIKEHAKKFDENIFKQKIKQTVEDRYEEFKKGQNQVQFKNI